MKTQPTRYMGIETFLNSFAYRHKWTTQPTRYMGIETTVINHNQTTHTDTTYSLYGYWNSGDNGFIDSGDATQPTRYMGIETLTTGEESQG